MCLMFLKWVDTPFQFAFVYPILIFLSVRKSQFINFSETHPDRFLLKFRRDFMRQSVFFSFAGLRGLRGKWWSCLSSSTGGESYWLIIIRLYYIRETCVETGY